MDCCEFIPMQQDLSAGEIVEVDVDIERILP